MSERLPSPEEIRKLPPEGGAGFNRLIHEKSPYLLQHARNPVDWYPWGPAAFAEAKKEDKPVFVSIGYSTCHWCHVMEVESFEQEDVARLLNEHFVSIKVDREERPDLDDIYITATQLFAGRGGWPNSVWLTPDGRPWYAGTYFPPEDRPGLPGFKSVLRQLAEAWRNRRTEVENQANEFAEAMKRASSPGAAAPGAFSIELVKAALDDLRGSFDERFGGFGAAPKFPPHTALRLLFYEYRRTRDDSLLRMAAATLDAMARGGIHDHVGGGFHRYSTDARWFLPHFEKMLYDNAQLAPAYVEGWLLTGNEEYRRVATDTCDWVLREMTDPAGGFYSALDADSEGQEGKFYLWTRAGIIQAIGEEEGDAFCRTYGVEENGNFHDEVSGRATGANILYLRGSLDKLAAAAGIAPEGLRDRLDDDLRKLLRCRSDRIRPHCDDKVLSGWNGLMIAGLAFAGKQLNERRYIAAAERAAEFVLTAMRKDGRLLRSYRQGEARLNAYLDDYAFLADGLLELHASTGNRRWLEEAKSLVAVLDEHYWDPSHGGFYLTSDDHEGLLLRLKPSYDQATPSGNGTVARVLVQLGELTGDGKYLVTAKDTLDAFLGIMQSAPQAAESLILAGAMFLNARKSGGTAAPGRPVTIELAPATVKVVSGGTANVVVRMTIARGYHVNSHKPTEDYLIPTELLLDGKNVASLGEVSYPAGKEARLGFSVAPLSVYEDVVTISAPIQIARNAPPGQVKVALKVRVQPCRDDACLAPEVLSVPLTLEIRPPGTAP